MTKVDVPLFLERRSHREERTGFGVFSRCVDVWQILALFVGRVHVVVQMEVERWLRL
jgi:hypothetical protein